MPIQRRRTDRVRVEHYFNHPMTVDSMAYFVKMCEEAGIPRTSQVTIHRNNETLGDCGFSADWFDTIDLPEDYNPSRFAEEAPGVDPA